MSGKRRFQDDPSDDDVEPPPKKRQKNRNKNSNSNSNSNSNNDDPQESKESKKSQEMEQLLTDIIGMPDALAKQLLIDTVMSYDSYPSNKCKSCEHVTLTKFISNTINELKNDKNLKHCLVCCKDINPKFDKNNCKGVEHEFESANDIGGCVCRRPHCHYLSYCQYCGAEECCDDFGYADSRYCYEGKHVTSVRQLRELGRDISIYKNIREYLTDWVCCDQCEEIIGKAINK